MFSSSAGPREFDVPRSVVAPWSCGLGMLPGKWLHQLHKISDLTMWLLPPEMVDSGLAWWL
jgi:hypothetical protein